jgi:hypothetical protein
VVRRWHVFIEHLPAERWVALLNDIESAGWTIFSTAVDRDLIVVAYKDKGKGKK